MTEFGLIARHFRPLAGPAGLDLLDDAAVLSPPPGRELVISADAMVAGVHYLPDDPAELVACKLLRVNLSDLAAMGATPLGYLVTVALPKPLDEAWVAGFAHGLAEDQAAFGLALLGGDTVATSGPLTLSLTILGHLAPGRAWRRNGGRAGDELWVTGTIGDAALGLLAARGEIADPGGFLADRYHLPQPRLGLPLDGVVHAAMDVSDGLVQDCGHLAAASGLAAVIHAADVPLSPAARACDRLATCLAGGDDYELLLAVPPGHEAVLHRCEVPLTRIGTLRPGSGVTVLNAAGSPMTLPAGWDHFSS